MIEDEAAGHPDGMGGLNKTSFFVEYSSTARATCRRCDAKIEKGAVRVGHTPLFRGKPGYVVYRHVSCAVFDEGITDKSHVSGYEELSKEDQKILQKEINRSILEVRRETEELEPDELVPVKFHGEMRPSPKGLTATLLPFQVEGQSWMYAQETKKEIKGGILADEMGMGKTLQTIAVICDNRSKLQHCKPGAKSPPEATFQDREAANMEEKLWADALKEWKHEMEMQNVPKKVQPRAGPQRGGTLVICPVIALTQWKTEIEKFCAENALTVGTYHGPNRVSDMPTAMLSKYDVVLTTYQVVEADFRKLVSPNKVSCPNCGQKFKIDKLRVHLKYFCGEYAEKTEAQARQRRSAARPGRRRNDHDDDHSFSESSSENQDDDIHHNKTGKGNRIAASKPKRKAAPKVIDKKKISPKSNHMKSFDHDKTSLCENQDEDSEHDTLGNTNRKSASKLKRKIPSTVIDKKKFSPKINHNKSFDNEKSSVNESATKFEKKTAPKYSSPLQRNRNGAVKVEDYSKTPVEPVGKRPIRKAALNTASRLKKTRMVTVTPDEDEDEDYSEDPSSFEDDETSLNDSSLSEDARPPSKRARKGPLKKSTGNKKLANKANGESDESSSADEMILREAIKKKRLSPQGSKEKAHKKKAPGTTKTKPQGGSNLRKGERAGNRGKDYPGGEGDSSDDDQDLSHDDEETSPGSKGKKKEMELEDMVDMDALMEQAMQGCRMSPLHGLCWWRVVLDEAHFIKSRSSQTTAAAFALISVHRWALSGTPLQNRVGEFYSLIRFLRIDPMAHYMCRSKDCECKSLHYRMFNGKCQDCGHSSIQHYSHFNKYVLNPIQRDGYSGDGRRAMFILKNEVLDLCLLRRTKATRAEDMNLPPRLVTVRYTRLHPIEEDFYNALYTQGKSSFDDFVAEGTLLNNYAHIFDLLMRMRQAVDHPYLVVHTKKDHIKSSPVANGTTDCGICNEEIDSRVVSSCCSSGFCRECVTEYMTTSAGLVNGNGVPCPSCSRPFSIDLNRTEEEIPTGGTPRKTSPVVSSVGMPSLKELPHVATGSILRRINLADFSTSSKIEALTEELVKMRRSSPGSKAIVFSQFVNMLDLIRWRLHSDPFLKSLGLGTRALHGGMDVKSRDSVLEDFRSDNNVRVLLMSLKAGGVALNLTVANHIYLMDPWWNPAAEMQAIDRTHRLGQYRPIRAVRFIAENTVEERILQLQEKKRLVFDGTVGRDAASLKMLTVDDMKSLFQ